MTYRMVRSAAFLALIAIVFSASVARADDEEEGEEKIWTVDFAQAKEAASIDDKSILMEFTGSDWCPPCKALHSKVLVTEEFKTEAPKEFVLLKLDNPRDKSNQSEEEQAQYKELSAKYKITGVPTIILADSQGRPYAKLVGYGGDEPDVYIGKLKDQMASLKKRDEAMAAAEKAEGVDKAKALDEALAVIGDSELIVATYGDVVDQIVELDAANEAGLKEKYETVKMTVEVKTKLREIQVENRGDSDAAIAAIEALVDEMKPEGELLQEILYAKGSMLFASDKEASKAALEAAQKAAPESAMAKRIETILANSFKEEEQKDDDKDDSGK